VFFRTDIFGSISESMMKESLHQKMSRICIFAAAFGTGSQPRLPRVRLLAVDLDRSFFSRLFLTSFSQGELKNLVSLEEVEDEKEGRRILERGKASALMILPRDFGADVWEGRETEILLLENPSEQILPRIAEEILDTSTLLFSAFFSVFSGEIETVRAAVEKDAMSDADVASISVRIKNKMEGISKYVFPPVISLKQETIASAAIGILCTGIMVGIGRLVFSIHWGNAFLVAAVILSLNILAANIMSSLGGCWWPIEIVPRTLQTLSYVFPTGWAMDSFHKLIFFGLGMESIIPHLLVLAGFTALSLFLAVRFFKLR